MTEIWENPQKWYDEWKKKSWRNSLVDVPQDEFEYALQSDVASVVPGVAGLYAYRDNTAYMSDYMRNRGLTYGDIRYPSRTLGWSAAMSLGSGLLTVSENLSRLYE